MRHRNVRLAADLLIIILTACGLGTSAWAGTTGNIKGKVTDIEDGSGLPVANILIVGSGRGGVTNEKGEYFISGVPGGRYTLRVSLLGYKMLEVKNIAIDAGETAVQDFKLASTLIEKEGLTVEGVRPIVDVKKTAGEQTYNKEKIDQLPNVKGVEDVLALQAGVVKFGNQLFLRGGRANETQIIIDGVVVNDNSGVSGAAGTSTANEQLQQLYSGSATGGALSVPANAIQSVSVSSSGLDAEFGNAQSGVVNITTKSGSENYNASLQYRTDGIVSNNFAERYYAATVSGPEPITQQLLPLAGIEVPGKLFFAMSSNFNQLDGAYAYSKAQFYNPVKRKVKFSGFFGNVLNGLGFTYSDKQDNDFSFNTKVSYIIGETDQFHFTYRANAGSSHPLFGSYGWRDRYDSVSSNTTLSTQNVFQWQHIFGTNSLLKGYINRLENSRESNVAGLPPSRYSSITGTSQGARDPNNDGFNDIGSSQSWSHSNTVTWSTKFDFSSKIHEYHFLKAGTDYYYQHVQSTAISFPLAAEREIDSIPRGEYPGYGLARWVSNNTPSHGSFYIQDNIELSTLTVKVGLRYDWMYLGKQVSNPSWVRRYEAVVNDRDTLTPYEYADWVDYTPDHSSFKARSFWKQFTRGFFSPRLAIGYPISTRTVFYFNYGHFLQFPDLDQYFHDPIITTVGGNYVGNPSLKPQKTIQYEAGFDQLVFEDLSLGIRGFYKDVFDYVSPRKLPISGRTVNKNINFDYASTRGFEIIVNKALRDHYFGGVNYTYSLAKGRTSNPFAVLVTPALQGLPREVRMDYDVQHRLSLYFGYSVGPKENYDVLGLNINNWSASVSWSYDSGFPYTPYNPGATLADVYLKNTGTGPVSLQLDIALSKGFILLDYLNVVFTLDVKNLLNRNNVDLTAGGFNSLTGRVTTFGDYTPVDPRYVYSWSAEKGGESFASRVPPFVFKPPRQILFGMKVNWN